MAKKKSTRKRREEAPEVEESSPGPGRPTEYCPEFCIVAAELAAGGATDCEIAKALEVDRVTLWRWRSKHPEFRNAIAIGKDIADDRVERSLYNRAVGYTFDSVKIFPGGMSGPVVVPFREHVPPDVGAALKWLANRRPEQWRDSQKVEHTFQVNTGDTASLEERLQAALRARTGPSVQ